jgi:two-component system NtrC family sensor kinase
MPEAKVVRPAAAQQPAGLVIYVDDDAASRVVFQRSLAALFRIEVAAGGPEALELMRRETPAVVLSDERMPMMGGAELLAQVRVLYPDALRVIVSAYSDPDAMLRAINEAGAARFMVKPWVRAEITALISALLTEHKMSQEIRALELDVLRSERFALLGRATAEVAHDLVNPLTSVMVSADAVMESAEVLKARLNRDGDSRDLLSADEAEALGDLVGFASGLKESARYMAELVGGIRNLSRPEQARPRANPRTIATFAMTLARGRIDWPRYVLSPMPLLPEVAISPVHLSQVLTNLLTNAGQAVPKGSTGVVECAAVEQDRGVEFTITDSGAGMPPELLAKLGVEDFTTKPSGEGTGLGVAVCFRLVRATGGRISYESSPGLGTKVKLWLPAA